MVGIDAECHLVIDRSEFPEEFNMFAIRKLPARFAPVVMPLVLSVLMTFVVSVISTLKSLGLTPAFLATWPGAWEIPWLVAFPTLLVVLPLVRRIVSWVEPLNVVQLALRSPSTPKGRPAAARRCLPGAFAAVEMRAGRNVSPPGSRRKQTFSRPR